MLTIFLLPTMKRQIDKGFRPFINQLLFPVRLAVFQLRTEFTETPFIKYESVAHSELYLNGHPGGTVIDRGLVYVH